MPMQNEIIVLQYANAYGLDADWSVEQIRAESNGNPNVTSSAGAQGIAQFIPATAARFGITNPFDIYQSLDGWGQYMSSLLNMFGGDYLSALAGYNAGEGTVKSYLTGKPLTYTTPSGQRKTINASGQITAHGIPPYKQTIDYVNKISRAVAYDQANGGVAVVDGLVVPTVLPGDNAGLSDDSFFSTPSTTTDFQDNGSTSNSGLMLALAAFGLIILSR